jgi:phage terminase large subunit GpA-like protein
MADEEYVEQLTAEKAIRKYVKGRGAIREWVKTRERNEALDLEVYALAALYILGPVLLKSLGDRARRFAKTVEVVRAERQTAEQQRVAQRVLRRQNSWMPRVPTAGTAVLSSHSLGQVLGAQAPHACVI